MTTGITEGTGFGNTKPLFILIGKLNSGSNSSTDHRLFLDLWLFSRTRIWLLLSVLKTILVCYFRLSFNWAQPFRFFFDQWLFSRTRIWLLLSILKTILVFYFGLSFNWDPKLYIPSTLNIALLQWHTHLNVCAVK